MKKITALFLLFVLIFSLVGCGNGKTSPANSAPAALKFSDSISLDRIQGLNGQKVTIIGYMATMSPISGKYMYLMNMPYQSCPFCVPNTTQLANTMAVYAPEGKTFDYTDRAIQVSGTLVVEDCVDEFGYTYGYRIADASYEIVDMSNLSAEQALWQMIAADGVIAELNGQGIVRGTINVTDSASAAFAPEPTPVPSEEEGETAEEDVFEDETAPEEEE